MNLATASFHPAAPALPELPRVDSRLRWADRLGALKVRWSFGRMDYQVEPGLYRLGDPVPASLVLVTGNYKLSFDALRSSLPGADAWILVLDTKGVNVWCAAGKGTFGTEELVRRVGAVGLAQRVSHRRLVLPQLGAVGVDALAAARSTGFSVVWGPVRAADLPAFLAAGMEATPRMRRVRFNFRDRLVLTPVELVQALKSGLPVLGVLFAATLLGLARFERADFLGLLGAVLSGCVISPALLPFIPGRAFAWKGFVAGALWTAAWMALQAPLPGGFAGLGIDLPRALAWAGLFPALSSFLAMNFTGASTYTSFSGVVAEMRLAVPLQVLGAAAGGVGLVAGAFIR